MRTHTRWLRPVCPHCCTFRVLPRAGMRGVLRFFRASTVLCIWFGTACVTTTTALSPAASSTYLERQAHENFDDYHVQEVHRHRREGISEDAQNLVRWGGGGVGSGHSHERVHDAVALPCSRLLVCCWRFLLLCYVASRRSCSALPTHDCANCIFSRR